MLPDVPGAVRVQSAPGANRCWKCGCTLPWNPNAYKHGLYVRPGHMPPTLADEWAHSQDWIAQVRTDQGSPDLSAVHDGAIRNLGVLDYSLRALVLDLKTRGQHARRGRVRSTRPLLLQTLDRWLRYTSPLGLERRQRDVLDADPASGPHRAGSEVATNDGYKRVSQES